MALGTFATSVGFAISAILIMIAFNRLHFLDLIPRARTTLIEGLQEGVVVLDCFDRVVDMNPAACGFLKVNPSIIGKKLGDVVSGLINFPAKTAEDAVLTPSLTDDGRLVLEITVTGLVSKNGKRIGRALLLRDNHQTQASRGGEEENCF